MGYLIKTKAAFEDMNFDNHFSEIKISEILRKYSKLENENFTNNELNDTLADYFLSEISKSETNDKTPLWDVIVIH